MLINDKKPADLDRLKEVKVKIPVKYHIRLLSMKVLTGKQISDAVSEALEAYFQRMGVLHHGDPSRLLEEQPPTSKS